MGNITTERALNANLLFHLFFLCDIMLPSLHVCVSVTIAISVAHCWKVLKLLRIWWILLGHFVLCFLVFYYLFFTIFFFFIVPKIYQLKYDIFLNKPFLILVRLILLPRLIGYKHVKLLVFNFVNLDKNLIRIVYEFKLYA
jgi:hypothetical protein